MRWPEPSARLLKGLAAAVWAIGGVVLTFKGAGLILEVEMMALGENLATWVGAAGLGLGGLKGRWLFDPACRRNLDRIDALERRRPWDFFRLRFFFALASMIALGATLTHLARGDAFLLLGVAVLDLSIGTALLLSGRNFLRRAR